MATVCFAIPLRDIGILMSVILIQQQNPQGNAANRLKSGGIFTVECVSVIILKIGKYLTKL